MRISPLDIRKQAFKKSLRGVDADEVRIFLELVASEYEKVLQENAMMAERIRHQEDRLSEYRELEKSMRNSLVTADRIAAESRDSSEREAARIVQDAQLRAERILEDARDRLQGLIREIETLKGKKEVYARRFWTLVEGQIGVLQEHLQDMGEVESLKARVSQLIAQTRGEAADAMPARPPVETEPEDDVRYPDLPSPVREEAPARPAPADLFTAPAADQRWMPPEVAGELPGRDDNRRGAEAVAERAPERGKARSLPRGLGRLLNRQAGVPAPDPREVPREAGVDLFPIRQRPEGEFDLNARDPRDQARGRDARDRDARDRDARDRDARDTVRGDVRGDEARKET